MLKVVFEMSEDCRRQYPSRTVPDDAVFDSVMRECLRLLGVNVLNRAGDVAGGTDLIFQKLRRRKPT